MGRARLGALCGFVAVGGFLALSLADCAEPTQIEIDVRTDACGVLKNAGIAVTSPEKIDTAELTIFTPDRPDNAGCEGKPSDRVGTLIVYPSGAKDATVGIRIVGGIGRTAQQCKAGDYAGCVVARRIEKFVEGSTKKVIVILSRACEGKDCGLGKECTQSGSCVVNLPDGGTEDAGTLDAEVLEAGEDGPTDAPTDGPPVDAGYDACAACTGGAGTTCNAGACNVACTGGACNGKAVCAAGLDCTMNCNNMNTCQNVTCAPGAKSCTFDCNTAGDPACNNITCTSPSCLVKCTQGGRCSGTINLGGGDAGLSCSGTQSCDTSGMTVNCDAGRCQLDCNGSCPDNQNCTDASSVCVANGNGATW